MNGVRRRSATRDIGETCRMRQLTVTFDHPSFERVEEGHVQFTGWCFSPDGPLTDLTLLVNGGAYPVRFALDRPDVADAFPDVPGAIRSGFTVSVPLRPGV